MSIMILIKPIYLSLFLLNVHFLCLCFHGALIILLWDFFICTGMLFLDYVSSSSPCQSASRGFEWVGMREFFCMVSMFYFC